MIQLGTRKKQNLRQGHPETGAQTRSLSRDVGLAKNVTASCTFAPASNQIQAAATTFAAFVGGEDILVEGTNLNNGYFHVISTDGSTQLTVDGNVKTEGPLSATIRTS